MPAPEPPHHAPRDQVTGRVRPYYLHSRRGRRSGREVPFDALVQTTEYGRRMAEFLSPTHRAICRLGYDAVAVAEIAARLRLPLGRARVLIAGLRDDHLLEVHAGAGDRPGLTLMERVLAGLRRA